MLDIQHSLTGIKALHKKQVIMVKDFMMMGTILKNGKQINIATLYASINYYNGYQMGTLTWKNGNTNVALHIVKRI